LPLGVCPRVLEIVENGVDLSLWQAPADAPAAALPTWAFVGRLVDWKAVDLLLQAFQRAARAAPMALVVMGDGPERPALERLAGELGIVAAHDGAPGVHFAGWMAQADCAQRLQRADALVLPSLLECGGAVVLEAMAMGKPVIATAWGGPLDYLDDRCGVLVPPAGREALVQGLADAMLRLAGSPALRREMGRHGLEKVHRDYDWEVKVDRMVAVYRHAVQRGQPGRASLPAGVS
jgi:glycosyltransferase involved in cell wall biosynthesis